MTAASFTRSTLDGLQQSAAQKNDPEAKQAVFDKFVRFAKARDVLTWNHVFGTTLDAYATYLEEQEYAPKTLRIELTTIVQAHKWLRKEKHLQEVEPLHLTIRKQESERAYCYRPEEVQAMLALCRKQAV